MSPNTRRHRPDSAKLGQSRPIAPQAAALFYHNLLAADPALTPLFRGDMIKQGHKLTRMPGAAVSKLDDLDTLVPILQSPAKRCGGGAKEALYPTVGAALLQTPAQGLGADFTPPVREAWAAVYSLVADVMIRAAHN